MLPSLSCPLEPLDATVGLGSGQSRPPACQTLPAVKMAGEKKKKIHLIGRNHVPLVPGRPGVPGSPDVIKHKSVRMMKAQALDPCPPSLVSHWQ